MSIKLVEDSEIYKRYELKGNQIGGKIVLEKYGDIWHVELIYVSPTGCGYGSQFLLKVLAQENLSPKKMTVCPTSEASRRFFQRLGFNC